MVNVFYEKGQLWDRNGYKLSTEYMDERFYFGETLEECLKNFSESTGITEYNLIGF